MERYSPTQLILNRENGWLQLGSPSHSQLLHSDPSDRVLVCPPHLGRGYVQDIPLRDDASLCILDYTLDRAVVLDEPENSDRIEFEFQLAGTDPGYSFFVPYFGLQQLGVKPARKRFFKVEIFFQRPALITYFRSVLERLSPQTKEIADRVTRSIASYRSGDISPHTGSFDRLWESAIAAPPGLAFEHILADRLYSEAIALNYATRTRITPEMERVISQILSCPYQGETRRRYLENRALTLVEMRLEAMVRPSLDEDDLHCIDRAASLLRNQIVNPPSVETLARQVGTNRLKLNQGFHHIYDTTPFAYLRECRLREARRLLMTSDLAIEEVATSVGYTSRSRFATAFRQKFGINPKAFQMQAWQRAS